MNNAAAREMVQTVMSERGYQTISRHALHQAVEEIGGIERARARADEYATTARMALDDLPASEFAILKAFLTTCSIHGSRIHVQVKGKGTIERLLPFPDFTLSFLSVCGNRTPFTFADTDRPRKPPFPMEQACDSRRGANAPRPGCRVGS